MLFKALVKNKDTGEVTTIESDYPSKSDFINDLKRNGYSVNRAEPKELYDFVADNFNGNKWDWEIAKKLYKENKPLTKEEFEKMKDGENDDKLDHEVVNDFSIDAIKDNFTPPGTKNKKKNLWKIGLYNKVGDDSDFKKFVREGDDLDTIVKQLREEYPEYANGGHDAQMAEEGEDLDEWLKLPGAQWHKGVKDTIDTNDNGKIEVDEMEDFQKSLDDYAAKNKKGREDIPATYKR